MAELATRERGRERRRSHGRGRNRQDRPRNYWHRKRPPLDMEWDFRVTLIRNDLKRKLRRVSIDKLVTGINWDDSGPMLTGSCDVINPEDEQGLDIREGHEVKLDYAPHGGGNYRELWRLRVTTPSLTASTGSYALTLADELEWLNRSEGDFTYKKGKGSSRTKRARGWLCHQIARDVARRYGLKVGRLAKGSHRIDNLTMTNSSPLKVLQKAYAHERDETGRRFVIKVVRGRLTITELRRSKNLLLVAPQLIEATLTRNLSEKFATVLDVSATERGDKGKEVNVTVRSRRDIRKRFGEVRKPVELSDPVASEAQARKRGRRRLARSQKPTKELALTVPGVPTLRRGDAIRVRERAINVRNQLVYVKTASHSVSAGNYTTDLTLRFNDPFVDREGDRIRKQRCKKAREHNRRPPKFCRDGFDAAAPAQGRRRNRRDSHGRDGRDDRASYSEMAQL